MRIAFTGPESSGKTSLSKEVAHRLNAQWFPEYAREYLLERNGEYNFEDIEKIGIKQEQSRLKSAAEGIKIYDTEGIVLYIWSVFKYGKCAHSIEKAMKSQTYDHYFLCSPEGIPWEDDPLRESPHQRGELFELYLKQLNELNMTFTILTGSFEERVKKALETLT